MVQLLKAYHARLLERIYHGSLYGEVGKLEALLPLIVGGAIFAAIDIGLILEDPFRLVVLVGLLAPGTLWGLYVLFHELKSLPQRYRRHKEMLDEEKL